MGWVLGRDTGGEPGKEGPLRSGEEASERPRKEDCSACAHLVSHSLKVARAERKAGELGTRWLRLGCGEGGT